MEWKRKKIWEVKCTCECLDTQWRSTFKTLLVAALLITNSLSPFLWSVGKPWTSFGKNSIKLICLYLNPLHWLWFCFSIFKKMSDCWICQIRLSYFKSYQSRSFVQKTSFRLDPQKKFLFLITDLYSRATCDGISPWSGCLRWHQRWRWRRLRQQKGRCGYCPAPDKMTPPCHCWRKIKKTLQRGMKNSHVWCLQFYILIFNRIPLKS